MIQVEPSCSDLKTNHDVERLVSTTVYRFKKTVKTTIVWKSELGAIIQIGEIESSYGDYKTSILIIPQDLIYNNFVKKSTPIQQEKTKKTKGQEKNKYTTYNAMHSICIHMYRSQMVPIVQNSPVQSPTCLYMYTEGQEKNKYTTYNKMQSICIHIYRSQMVPILQNSQVLSPTCVQKLKANMCTNIDTWMFWFSRISKSTNTAPPLLSNPKRVNDGLGCQFKIQI